MKPNQDGGGTGAGEPNALQSGKKKFGGFHLMQCKSYRANLKYACIHSVVVVSVDAANVLHRVCRETM